MNAALFFASEQESLLISDNEFCGTDNEDHYAPVVRRFTLPAGFNQWSFPGNVSDLAGTTGFCLIDETSVVVLQAGDSCADPIFLIQVGKSKFAVSSLNMHELIHPSARAGYLDINNCQYSSSHQQ